MAPYNDHLLGYRTFARGAVRAGLNDLAERYLIRIMSDHDTYYETEEMADLARIWFHRGDVSKAKELLLDCISKSDAASEKSEFPDERKRLTKHIELMRKTYAELFPDDKAASEAKP
jgi:hypothetical protein